MECLSCGAVAPSGSRFCPSCAYPLTPVGDERRVVTVVFADLVGYTRLGESMDPERLKLLLDRGFERLSREVIAFGGTVDKIVGDEIVAVFGAPTSHEDDAERAVRAALRLHEILAAYGTESDLDLQLRVGVNTGEVLVGTMAGGDDYTVMGDVVNVAQRLETAARPGQTLVGAATYAETRDVIAYDSVGRVRARGRDEPIEAWSATAPTAPPGHRQATRRSPFVGRDRELTVVRTLIDLAMTRSRAQAIVLIGEAGVGKRRLAEEAGALATAEHGAKVLVGRCLPYGEAGPMWPLIEMIHAACDLPIGTPADELADVLRAAVRVDLEGVRTDEHIERITEGVLHVVGVPGALDGLEPAKARDEAYRALVDFLDVIINQVPVVLAFTQVQWADESLDGLFAQVLRRLNDRRFVILATGRPDLLDRWRPPPRTNVTVLEIAPLDAAAASGLLGALLGRTIAPEPRGVLLERSGGNPLYLEELVALLEASGGLDDHSVAAGEPHGLRVPGSLRGLIGARLDALAPEYRSLIEDAAVVGRTGPLGAVWALADRRGAATERSLRGVGDLLVARDGEYEFKSDVVREVAYARLPKAERARRHAAVGSWFAVRQRDTDQDVHEHVAQHYGTAARLTSEFGRVDDVPDDILGTAIVALDEAAARARARDLLPVAERWYDEALALAADPGEVRTRLLLGRAHARVGRRDLDGAQTDVDAVLDHAADDDVITRATALTILGDIRQKRGQLDEAVATLESATALWTEVESGGSPEGPAETMRTLGMTHLFAGRIDDAEKAIVDALELARVAADRRGEAWAEQNLAWISFMRGDTREAESRLESAALRFGEIKDRAGLAWAFGLLGWVRFYEGRLEDAEALAEQVLPEAEAVDDRWGGAITKVLLAAVRLWRGRAAQSVTLADEARATFRDLDDAWGELQSLLPLSRALVAVGRLADGRRAIADARSLAKRVPDPSVRLLTSMYAAQIAVTVGDVKAVLREMDAIAADVGENEFVDDAERLGLRGLGRLLDGEVGGALADLAAARGAADTVSRWAFVGGAYALALLADGQVDRADEVALDAATSAITYLDRLFAHAASAFVHVHRADPGGARAALQALAEGVDDTDDVVAKVLCRLVEARVLAALGDGSGAAVLDDARGRCRELGIRPRAWEELFGKLAA